MARETTSSGASPAYQTPLLLDSVADDDPNAQLSAPFSQDGSGTFSVSLVNGANSGGSVDPAEMAYHIIPMKDLLGELVELDELDSCQIYLDIASGMGSNDKTFIYTGIVVGPAITDDRLWGRIDSNGAFIGRCRVGDGVVQAAAPSGTGVVRGRIDFYTKATATADRMEVVNFFIDGLDSSNQRILNAGSTIAGVASVLSKVPHILIAAGGFTTTAPQTITFNVQYLATRRPGGVLPQP